jgi:hypothetical protein
MLRHDVGITVGCMKTLRFAIAILAVIGAAGWFGARPAYAMPHGCASFTRDVRAQFDPRSHSVGVDLFVDQPCSFVYAEGDTYSGSGRFTVTCETGGHVHHPDFQDGQYPPVANVPIPQPCAVGARVTLEGYRAGTGGGVIAGGLCGTAPGRTAACARNVVLSSGKQPRSDDWKALCKNPAAAAASVNLTEPIDYSGLLTYTGALRCDRADLTIKSLKATPYLGYNRAALGPASCRECTRVLSLSGTVPAESWVWEVVMQFTVRAGGKSRDGVSVGRYLATWAGVPVEICGPDTCPI